MLSYNEFAQSSLQIDALSRLGDGLYAVANGGDALVLLRRAPIDSSGRQIVKVACCDAAFTASPAVLALNGTDDIFQSWGRVCPWYLIMLMQSANANQEKPHYAKEAGEMKFTCFFWERDVPDLDITKPQGVGLAVC